MSVGSGVARENAVVAFLDLVESPGIVIPMIFFWSMARCMKQRRRKTYEVTGMSPQSSTVAQLSKGLVSRGTLYPPLNAHLVRGFIRKCRA